MEMIDFTNCPYSDKNGMYGGMAGRKDGIIYNDENWMVKFPKTTKGMKNVPISYTTAPLNEYIGSHIYQLLGYDTHETLLGMRNNKIVVACKDFEVDGKRLMEARTIKNHANNELGQLLDRNFDGTGSTHFVNFDELYLHIKHNDIFTNTKGVEERFWDMCVVDLFIRNGDRNTGNWGLLNTKDGRVLAPIFDNGGCFTDKADDEKLSKLLKDEILVSSAINFRSSYGHETEKNNPNSVKQMNGKDFIEFAMQFSGFRKAIIKNVELIQNNISDIYNMITEIPNKYQGLDVCSDIQKKYFIVTLGIRFNKMLAPAYMEAKNYKESDFALENKVSVFIEDSMER